MINIQLTYHGHPIYQICFLNTVMPVALTLTIEIQKTTIYRKNQTNGISNEDDSFQKK